MANCRTLSSIDINTCTGNKGGIYTEVIFASRTALDPKREGNLDGTTPNQETGYAVLTAPSEAFYIKFRKQSSGLTSEGTFDEANGVYFFTNNLNLVIARQEVAKRLALQSLVLADDVAFLVKDGNNNIQFLGMDDTVSTTAMTAQTGVASTDGNNYNVTFTDTSNELPYYVKESSTTASDVTWETLKALAEAGSGSGDGE